ncbi:MAG: diphthine synthase [Candidatus Marinimicrobia bacterium]|nr:diphthine synthase [Candidatus Neomarinimicrobiota bacterium]
MLTMIGLGLGGPNSITMDGVIALSMSEHIFYETYTSPIHSETLEWIEMKSERKPIYLARSQVEEPEELVKLAKETNVCLLVVGDALSATTHVSLLLDCKKNNIECKVIHNASVLTAVAGVLGLQHYNFGPVATLVLPEGNYRPLSPIDKIKTNMENGNHSLVLLDIKADNPDKEPRYMTASQAAEQMIEAGIQKNTMVAAAARVGREDQQLWYGKLKYLANKDLGKEPHSIVVPSRLHFTEQDFLESL